MTTSEKKKSAQGKKMLRTIDSIYLEFQTLPFPLRVNQYNILLLSDFTF